MLKDSTEENNLLIYVLGGLKFKVKLVRVIWKPLFTHQCERGFWFGNCNMDTINKTVLFQQVNQLN